MEIEPLGAIVLFVSRFTPFLLVVGAFSFVYVFIPNCRVKLKYAFIGGLIAGISWQAAGMLFASFVAGSAKYAAIYSSFAIGIILLIWVYLNWMILLLGSSIAFYLQNPGSVAKRYKVRLSPELLEKTGLALMWLVARPFHRGEPAPQQERVESELRVPGEVTRALSDKLIRAGVINLAGRGGDCLVPACSLDKITVGRVLKAIRADEDRVVQRLPVHIPRDLLAKDSNEDSITFARLLDDEALDQPLRP